VAFWKLELESEFANRGLMQVDLVAASVFLDILDITSHFCPDLLDSHVCVVKLRVDTVLRLRHLVVLVQLLPDYHALELIKDGRVVWENALVAHFGVAI